MLLLSLFILLAAFIYIKHKQFQQIYSQVPMPGPPPAPLIGNSIQLIRLKRDLLLDSLEWFNKYGNMVQIFLLHKRLVLIGPNEKAVKDLYTSNSFVKGDRLKKRMEDLFGKTPMIFSDGEIWARVRRICTSPFNVGHLKLFSDRIQTCTDMLVEKLKEKASTIGRIQTIDMDELFMHVALDVIGRTMFSIDFQCVENGHSRVSEAVATYMEIVGTQTTNPLMNLHPIKNYRRRKAAQFLSLYVANIISMRVAEKNLSKSGTETIDDLMDLLLDAQDPETGAGLSNEEVKDQVMTFLMAGHETTAHTMSWVVAQIAKYPEVAKRVYEEIDDVVSNSPNKILEYEDVSKLIYLSAVIKETMRMFPVVPTLIRTLDEDCQVDKYALQKGDLIILNIVALHYNPAVWKDPTVFDPSRFLKSDSEASSDTANAGYFAFSSFGHGRRGCIGQNFALLEIKIILASLLHQFRFSLTPMDPVIPQQFLTFRPKDGLPMNIWTRRS